MNTNKAIPVKGYLERITPDSLILGWARVASGEACPNVFIYINQQFHSIVEADQVRDDLRQEGIDGMGFSVDISAILYKTDKVEVRAYLDRERSLELGNSPLMLGYENDSGISSGLDEDLGTYTSLETKTKIIHCYFEGINRKGEVYGWACDPSDVNEKPDIHIFYGEYPVGVVRADQYRDDLRQAGITNGEAGFSLGLSDWEFSRLSPGHKIHAYLAGDFSRELRNSPYKVTHEDCTLIKSTHQAVILKRLTGTLEALTTTARITGWARDPLNPAHKTRVYFFASGVFLGSTVADQFRGDLKEAGFDDGKCAFEWLDMSFSGLCMLKRTLQIKAYFDENQHRELGDSPLRLTQKEFTKLWTAVLDPNRVDTTIEARSALLEAMLFSRLGGQSGGDINADDEVYKHALQICMAFYKNQQYRPLLNLLTDEIIDFRRKNNLPVFDLLFYRLMCMMAVGSLDMRVLQSYEGLIYREVEANKKIQSANSVRQKYDQCISQSCIDNFNQVVVSFYPEDTGVKSDIKLISRYIQIMARCLTLIYQDPHMALNYINILGRDGQHQKTADFYVLAGKINQQLNYNYEALQYYLQAAKISRNSWLTFNEASFIYGLICHKRIDLYRQKYHEVIELLLQGLQLNPQQSLSYRHAEKFHQDFADTSLKWTRQLADYGDAQKALQDREYDLRCLADSIMGFRQACRSLSRVEIPEKPFERRYGSIVFMASQALWQCFYYRVKQKLEHARSLGFNTLYVDFSALSKQGWEKDLMRGDILYICRLPATYDVLNIIGYARSLDIPVIYDIDDLIFDERHFPSPIESYAGTIDDDLHLHLWMDNPLFRVAMQHADLVTCSTSPLAEQIRSIEGLDIPVVIYPNLMSEELKINALKSQAQPTPDDSPQAVEIFYGSATKAHKQAFYDVLCPALAVIMSRHAHVHLTLIGYFSLPKRLQGYSDRISLLAPSPNYMGYINRLKQSHINIAILEQDVFTDCKSELKWFEAGAFGIPSVVTPTATYRHVLKPEHNVLFASDTDEWMQQLDRLVQSATLRETVGKQARADTFTSYQPAVGVDILKQLLEKNLPHEPVRQKIRILFVNVFFAPQSIGGATRIVESHVRYLMERFPDEFEVHVLTTEADPRNWMPYSVEQYLYGSALVTKLRIPAREWAEYHDEKVYNFCLDYYRLNRFDIIHFHSIQVLTASVVDAARELNIPYLVTLHDGWWLSRHLFLMNEQGHSIDPSDPFSGTNAEQDDLLWLLERRNRLSRCLGKAHSVLAVSEKFRLLHEATGLEANFQCNENGLELFEVLPRQKHVTGKIRVAHIGGMSSHKGFDLLKDTITAGNFSHIDVMVIDHSLEPGDIYHDYWGSTLVSFRAKIRQSEVNELYSQMDVLIAPSLWPESYGLVTREALYAGVWVIASDRGAIGEAITEGVNGRVIDVASPLGLMTALQEIEANPGKFTRQLDSVIPRTSDEQAAECVSMYRAIRRVMTHEETSGHHDVPGTN